MKSWNIIRRYEHTPDLPVLAEVEVLVIGGVSCWCCRS